MSYDRFQDDELALRDHLAIDRTAMANERTFLAYARTAIMVAATSVTLFQLFADSSLARVAAIALIPAALVIALAGCRRYWVLSKALRSMKR